MRLASFLAHDFTEFRSAHSKFSSLEECITDGGSSRAGATPEVAIGRSGFVTAEGPHKPGSLPPLKLFRRLCFAYEFALLALSYQPLPGDGLSWWADRSPDHDVCRHGPRQFHIGFMPLSSPNSSTAISPLAIPGLILEPSDSVDSSRSRSNLALPKKLVSRRSNRSRARKCSRNRSISRSLGTGAA